MLGMLFLPRCASVELRSKRNSSVFPCHETYICISLYNMNHKPRPSPTSKANYQPRQIVHLQVHTYIHCLHYICSTFALHLSYMCIALHCIAFACRGLITLQSLQCMHIMYVHEAKPCHGLPCMCTCVPLCLRAQGTWSLMVIPN